MNYERSRTIRGRDAPRCGHELNRFSELPNADQYRSLTIKYDVDAGARAGREAMRERQMAGIVDEGIAMKHEWGLPRPRTVNICQFCVFVSVRITLRQVDASVVHDAVRRDAETTLISNKFVFWI